MRKHGSITTQIIDLLTEQGPMTRSEIDQNLKSIEYKIIASTISHLKRKSKIKGRRIYIKQYVYDDEIRRYYPRAVYALGDQPDAKKPPRNDKLTKQRYLEKVKGKYKLNNVFNLGLTRDAIYALRKAA